MSERNVNSHKHSKQDNQAEKAALKDDDRFPGTSFRISQPSVPGKTAWKPT